MAKIFEDITLSWGDDEFVISGDDQIMRLIARIEEEVTLQDLSTGSPKMSAVASAYAAALNFAGASAKPSEVYASLFVNGGQGTANVVAGLLAMMVPPGILADDSKKKQEA